MSSLGNERQHIINKIRAELTMPSSLTEGGDRSEQLKKAVQKVLKRIVPRLDRAFGDNKSYRVEFLSVELDLQKDDMGQLERLLEEALMDKVMLIRQQADIRIRGKEPDKEQYLEEIEPKQRRRDLLTYFLHSGKFPWWAERASLTELEDMLRELSARDWLDYIKPLVRNHPGVLRRLAAQFPEDLVRQMIKKSSAEKTPVNKILKLLKEIGSFFEEQNFAYGARRHVFTQLYATAFSGILFEEAPETVVGNITSAALEAFPDLQTGIEEWKNWLEKSDEDKGRWMEVMEEISGAVEGEDEQDRTLESNILEDDDLAVSNGGLVLLHPFIESLFENLGLLEEGEFSRTFARERAVCLLHHMATGSEEFPEQELALPIFLCAWRSEEPVNRFLPISEYEIEECNAVLSSAISHWEALKSTSIEEFRSNFLQRKGILREEEFGWSLYIEQKTQDILLEKLPWSLSVVKLEWMDEMLTVHWQS